MTKTILISGGMGGIGREIARIFALDGYQVAVLFKSTTRGEAEAFIGTLPGSGHMALPCDLVDADAVKAVVSRVQATSGSIDVCVHAAVSRIVRKKVAEMDIVSFRQEFEVSVFGAFNLFKPVAEVMKAQKSGAIIGFTSAVITEGSLGYMPGYVAAKFALKGLLREMAKELKPYGITVSEAALGLVATRLNSDLPAEVSEFLRRNPAKRPLSPQEAARAVQALCVELRS